MYLHAAGTAATVVNNQRRSFLKAVLCVLVDTDRCCLPVSAHYLMY